MNASRTLLERFRAKLDLRSARSSSRRNTASQIADPEVLAGIYAPPENPSKEPRCCFPLLWYKRFLEEIRKRKIEILTYDDLLADSNDRDYRNCYPREFREWHLHNHRQRGRIERVLTRSRIDRPLRRRGNRVFLLIQHDVDSLPIFTKRMVAMEAEHGIRSNIFIFRHRYTGLPKLGPYNVDCEFFKNAERAGFVIGYHQNALHLAGFDVERATKQFYDDVMYLRNYFAVKYFCPHGGESRSVNGRILHNADVPIPQELQDAIQWVSNRYGLRFSWRWSDGGLRSIRDIKRLRGLDIIEEFVKKMEAGKRYFLLIHPQLWGFNVNMNYNPLLAEQPWYQAVCRRFGAA